MSGKRRRQRLSKKEYEQLERKEAQRELDARSESEKRQERIKVLWKELQSGHLAKETDKELAETELVCSLVELVDLQKAEIETHASKELEAIQWASFRELADALSRTLPKLTPKQEYERKRGNNKWCDGVGLIKYDFGGAGEAERRKRSLAGSFGSPYEPTCLDDIFAGDSVRMRSEDVALKVQPSGLLAPFLPKTQHKAGLEELFGMERHRFGKDLPSIKKGTEKWYDYYAVVKIMHRLLSEKPREGKGPTRGKNRRIWLCDRNERMRVLTGIVGRMQSLSVPDDIWEAFNALVRRHLG